MLGIELLHQLTRVEWGNGSWRIIYLFYLFIYLFIFYVIIAEFAHYIFYPFMFRVLFLELAVAIEKYFLESFTIVTLLIRFD